MKRNVNLRVAFFIPFNVCVWLWVATDATGAAPATIQRKRFLRSDSDEILSSSSSESSENFGNVDDESPSSRSSESLGISWPPATPDERTHVAQLIRPLPSTLADRELPGGAQSLHIYVPVGSLAAVLPAVHVQPSRATREAKCTLLCRWTRWRQPLDVSRMLPLANGSLLVLNVSVEDEGYYICEASNLIVGSDTTTGAAEAVAGATVSLKPFIRPVVSVPSQIVVGSQSDVSLTCSVEAYPKPSVRWERILSDRTHVNLTVESILPLLAVTPDDSGEYRCTASNAHGQASATTKLLVQDCQNEVASHSRSETWPQGSAKWHAVLWDKHYANNQGRVICSGVLLKKRFLLAPAHCLLSQTRKSHSFNQVVVKVGMRTEVQERRIDGIIIHPLYNKTTLNHDLALVRLHRGVYIPKEKDAVHGVSLAALPEPNSFSCSERLGTPLVVSGFAGVPGKLRVSETFVRLTNCTQWRKHQSRPSSSPHLCASFRPSQRRLGSCKANAGAPAVVFDTSKGQWQVVGLVNVIARERCNTGMSSMGLTRVSEYTAWIQSKLATRSF